MDNLQEFSKKPGISSLLIESGELDDHALIGVSGGEPFLRSDITDIVAPFLQNDKYYTVLLSTNGTLPGRVKKLISNIEDASRLHMSISLDGIEETHNRIRGNDKAFKSALETIKFLCENSVSCHVNMVVQADNYSELDKVRVIVESVSRGKAKIGYIPVIEEIVNDPKTILSNHKNIYKYVQAPKDIKRLVSRGSPLMHGCHGGVRNIAVSPAGRVFTCLKSICWGYDETLCMGDLKKDTLKTILSSEKAQNARLAAKNCNGCSIPCDVDREESLFGLSFELTEEETDLWYSFFDEPLVFASGWYQNEKTDPDLFRWMSEKSAVIMINNRQQYKNIYLSFENYYPINEKSPIVMTVIHGEQNIEQICRVGKNEIHLTNIENIDPVKIILKINKRWRPSDFSLNNDTRKLGLAISEIRLE
jgi:radical SAM protein with 4Fe4S-binding SPASM domain